MTKCTNVFPLLLFCLLSSDMLAQDKAIYENIDEIVWVAAWRHSRSCAIRSWS